MLHGFWHSERGFSLTELMVVIIIMGIVSAVAMSFWWPVVESRRVDSATNQVVSELRRAHTSATNRLEDWRVEMDAGTPNYRVGPAGGPLSPQSLLQESDEEGDPPVELTGGVSAVVFEPNGEATITGAGNISVADTDGDGPCHEIEVNPVTSRIEVLTNAC